MSTTAKWRCRARPLRFQDLDPPAVSLPRNAGADNVPVYGDLLGLSADEVASLKDAGAI